MIISGFEEEKNSGFNPKWPQRACRHFFDENKATAEQIIEIGEQKT